LLADALQGQRQRVRRRGEPERQGDRQPLTRVALRAIAPRLPTLGLAPRRALGYQLDMLGNSAGVHRGVGLAFGAILLFVTACPKMVPQDSHTGADGKPKGAKKVTLENGEGKARGIVTYPGGDRVDWKSIELPKDKTGTLTLKLNWQAPRPGLDLSFAVYDEYFWPIAEAKPKKKSKRTSKKLDPIANAKGTYYVMVYASNRGDAGKYTLSVSFEESQAAAQFDLSKVEIPDPPKLPTVPEAPVACDPTKYDPKNPACINVCPIPPDTKIAACKDVCPTPPDVNIKACQKTMDCPDKPDRRVTKCMDTWNVSKPAPWPPCDYSKKDPGNPNCDVKLTLTAKVVDVQSQGSDVVITVNKGSGAGVAQGWNGKVTVGGKIVPNGDFVVIRVTKGAAIGKVHLTVDAVSKADVILTEP
jgi:hypothetical protein